MIALALGYIPTLSFLNKRIPAAPAPRRAMPNKPGPVSGTWDEVLPCPAMAASFSVEF